MAGRRSSRCRGALALAGAAGLGLGCNVILDYQAGTPRADEAEEGLCCAEPIPLDWEGPAVLYAGEDAPPACTGPWVAGPVGGLEIDAPRTSCDCGCGNATATCTAALSFFSNSSCTADVVAESASSECTSIDVGAFVAVQAALLTQAAACSVHEESSPEPAAFSVQAQLCLSREPTRCGAGLCDDQVPLGYPTRKCVYRSGEHTCPDGAYSERLTLFRAIDDQRACECRCDDGALACTGVVWLYEEDDCTGPGQTLPSGECAQVSLDFVESVALDTEVTGACPPTSLEVSGSADGASPVAVCCQPDV